MEQQNVEAVLLAGPTASGKSALALTLAQRFNGVIINADSMQVYADLHILSARPPAAETALAPHRMYGHVDGALNYSVGLWLRDCAAELAAARAAGRLPVIIGGTGLYFRGMERGLAEMPAVPDAVRQAVRAEAERLAGEALHARLAGLDPTTAAGLRPSDRQRLIRALEVYVATGRPLVEWQSEPHSPPLIDPSRCLRLFLSPDRAWLYQRIDARFDAMLAAGALDEVATLAARGLDPALPVMRAHGVPWLIRNLRGEIDTNAARNGSAADTRHYARRQFTWFRNQMPGWTITPPEAALAIAESALTPV